VPSPVTVNPTISSPVTVSTVVQKQPETLIAKKISIEEKLQKPISLMNLDINKEPVHIPLQNEKKNVENIKQLKFVEEQQKKHQNYINKTQTSSVTASPTSSVDTNISSQASQSLFGVSGIKANSSTSSVIKTDMKTPTNKIDNVSKNIKTETANNSTSSIVSTPPKNSSVSGNINIATPTMNSSSISSTTSTKMANATTVKKPSTPSTPNIANKIATTSTVALSNTAKVKINNSTKSSGVNTPVKAHSSNNSSSNKITNTVVTTSNQLISNPAIANKNLSPVLNARATVGVKNATIANTLAVNKLNNVGSSAAPNTTTSMVGTINPSLIQLLSNPELAQLRIQNPQKFQQKLQQLNAHLKNNVVQQQALTSQALAQPLLQESQQLKQVQPQKTPVQPAIQLPLQNKVQVQQQTNMQIQNYWKGILHYKFEGNISINYEIKLIARPKKSHRIEDW